MLVTPDEDRGVGLVHGTHRTLRPASADTPGGGIFETKTRLTLACQEAASEQGWDDGAW